MGRQVHFGVGGDAFYLDLLFFHIEQLRYVVVELKTGRFQPEYAGKLGFWSTHIVATSAIRQFLGARNSRCARGERPRISTDTSRIIMHRRPFTIPSAKSNPRSRETELSANGVPSSCLLKVAAVGGTFPVAGRFAGRGAGAHGGGEGTVRGDTGETLGEVAGHEGVACADGVNEGRLRRGPAEVSGQRLTGSVPVSRSSSSR